MVPPMYGTGMGSASVGPPPPAVFSMEADPTEETTAGGGGPTPTPPSPTAVACSDPLQEVPEGRSENSPGIHSWGSATRGTPSLRKEVVHLALPSGRNGDGVASAGTESMMKCGQSGRKPARDQRYGALCGNHIGERREASDSIRWLGSIPVQNYSESGPVSRSKSRAD